MSNSFSVNGWNATLSYTSSSGTVSARIRVKELSHTYGVVSTESQSRQTRGFYPYRRSQGKFLVVPDCIGYKEQRQLMNWLRDYGRAVLDIYNSNNQPPPMTVSLPARKFLRQAILTTGIMDEDHTASMIFNPNLVFISISDPNDSLSSILTADQVSAFNAPLVDVANSTTYFFPQLTPTAPDASFYNVATSSFSDVNDIVEGVSSPTEDALINHRYNQVPHT